MDPLLDYYLCVKDGEPELWIAFGEPVDALPGYDSVQKLTYSQALQWDLALREIERPPAYVPDLFPLAAFMQASDELIAEFFGEE
jgi:hypothetical protein